MCASTTTYTYSSLARWRIFVWIYENLSLEELLRVSLLFVILRRKCSPFYTIYEFFSQRGITACAEITHSTFSKLQKWKLGAGWHKHWGRLPNAIAWFLRFPYISAGIPKEMHFSTHMYCISRRLCVVVLCSFINFTTTT